MKKILISVLLCLLLISCKDFSLDPGSKVNGPNSSSWMSLVEDNTKLINLSIPGTHDSCAMYDFMGMSSTGSNQDLTLKEQLEAGVRFVDIRPCLVGDELIITHGITKQHITLDEVFEILFDFLEAHPSETITIAFLTEWKDECDFSHLYEYLKEFIPTKKDYLITGSSLGEKKLSELTMSECRGKIILTSRMYFYTKEIDEVCCLDYYESEVPYYTVDADENWKYFLYLVEYFKEKSYFHSIFLSCYYEGQFGIPNVRIMSSYLNKKLSAWLDEYNGTEGLGYIVCDHITRDLAYKIYSRNLPQTSN